MVKQKEKEKRFLCKISLVISKSLLINFATEILHEVSNPWLGLVAMVFMVWIGYHGAFC